MIAKRTWHDRTWQLLVLFIERSIRPFIKPCPLCGKKPQVQLFYFAGDLFLENLEENIILCLFKKRWRLHIGCANPDAPRDENCMIWTGRTRRRLLSAIIQAKRYWNCNYTRRMVRETLADKTWAERGQAPRRIVGYVNGVPGTMWMKEQIKEAIGAS